MCMCVCVCMRECVHACVYVCGVCVCVSLDTHYLIIDGLV